MGGRKILVWGMLVGSLVGCGQDPYRDQPENVKNAQGRVIKKAEPPIGERDLMIDSSSALYNFTESKTGTIQLVAKSFRPGVTFSVFVENMEAFPGATFDPATLLFTWTPSIGFIRSGRSIEMALKATLVTDKGDGGARMSTSHIVRVAVAKYDAIPEILSVDNFGDEVVYSGETRSFRVRVRDEGATETPEGTPIVKLLPAGTGQFGIAHYISSSDKPVRDSTDPSIWEIPMTLDLRSITNSRAAIEYNFGFVAMSGTGLASRAYPFKIKVVNRVGRPQVSFSSRVYFTATAGRTRDISFSAFDANGDGTISAEVKGLEELPGTSAVTCENKAEHFSLCTLTWNPSLDSVGKEFTLQVDAVNRPSWLNEEIRESYSLNLKVEAPAVNPAPSPGPSPLPVPPTTAKSPGAKP